MLHKTKFIFLADPTILFDQGKYYLYGTSSHQGFKVYESTDLDHWEGPAGHNNGFALSKGESFGDNCFWAPQVFKHTNRYYMVYAANQQIAIATSDSPLGPFQQKDLKPLFNIGKQIDPFIFFDHDGKCYIYYVKIQKGYRIYVSEITPDLSEVIEESTKECITAAEPWENIEKTRWTVTEGPTVVKHKNLYYLIYSANSYRNKDYAIGYATAESPLGPWTKYSGNPIISRSTIQYNGAGHGDLFKDHDGDYRYVFHTHYSSKKVSPRSTGLIHINFIKNEDNEDVLIADKLSFRHLLKQ